jgi:prepilin-type processing-associated H-X9-DG protein
MKSKTRDNDGQTGGFTLIELLAILAILALASILLTPALAKVQPNTQTFQCLNNARQLATALAMYSADNHDFFPPNPDDGSDLAGYEWVCDMVSGGMPPGTTQELDMCNPDILTNVSKCLVAPYLGGKAAVFRCPADPRYGIYSGTNTAQKGRTISAVRSVSMNAGVGTIDPSFAASGAGHSGKPTLPVNGPWLDGNHTHRANSPYATFGKTTDFGVVRPAQIFLVSDEDPWSIDDASFAVSAAMAKWVDFPAVWHDHGCTFSFCDGHVELHQWTGTTLGLLAEPGLMSVRATDPDWTWVVSHATVNLQ